MPEPQSVGVAQLRVGQAPELLKATGIGSCVIVAVWNPSTRQGGMAHCLLPRGPAEDAAPAAKFCDLGVDALVAQVADGRPQACRAWLVGGAAMFAGTFADGTVRVGERNVAAARERLGLRGVPLVGEDCGGDRGRGACLDCADGTLTVWSAVSPPRRI